MATSRNPMNTNGKSAGSSGEKISIRLNARQNRQLRCRIMNFETALNEALKSSGFVRDPYATNQGVWEAWLRLPESSAKYLPIAENWSAFLETELEDLRPIPRRLWLLTSKALVTIECYAGDEIPRAIHVLPVSCLQGCSVEHPQGRHPRSGSEVQMILNLGSNHEPFASGIRAYPFNVFQLENFCAALWAAQGLNTT
jgi:hypothetical protein